MNLTKSEINKLLVEERKKSRLKQKNSEFMKRSLNIYKGQQTRLMESQIEMPYVKNRSVGISEVLSLMPFSLDEFRGWLQPFIDQKCQWCTSKMTIKSFAVDHRTPIARGGDWVLSNLACICKPCNFRKGQLTEEEFAKLCNFVNQELSAGSREDVWRRLVLGGKWSFGK